MKEKLRSNVPMQPNIPPMPSKTSNALEALDSVNATQFNALDRISRQAAIDALNHESRCGAVIDHCGLETAMDIISELPPATQTEIIRCKDCKYYNSEEKECLDLLGHGRRWEEYDFCNYAERKQNDTERC